MNQQDIEVIIRERRALLLVIRDLLGYAIHCSGAFAGTPIPDDFHRRLGEDLANVERALKRGSD